MYNLSLRAAHPAESKEVSYFSSRVITSVVIAMSGFLSLAPVAAYLTH